MEKDVNRQVFICGYLGRLEVALGLLRFKHTQRGKMLSHVGRKNGHHHQVADAAIELVVQVLEEVAFVLDQSEG